jgi:hypothetical protein
MLACATALTPEPAEAEASLSRHQKTQRGRVKGVAPVPGLVRTMPGSARASHSLLRGLRRNLGRGESGMLDLVEQSATDDLTIGTANAAEQSHHELGLPERKLGREDEACVPAPRGGLEAFVLPIGEFKQQQQRVRERHERMFS